MIRKFLKKVLPESIISKLRWLQKHLYNMFLGPILRKRANYYKNKNQEKADKATNKKQIVVVFLAVVPASWNSLKPIYEEAKKRKDMAVKLLVVPEIKTLNKKNFEYFKTIEPKAIDAYENQKWIDLKSLRPDFIFQQTPYDHQLPKVLRSSYTARFTKVCYVPYGYNSSPGKHLDIEYNDRFVMNVSKIFADNMTSYEYCQKHFTKQKGYGNIEIYNYGFPRFDLCRDKNKKVMHNSDTKKQFMWIPRWSVDSVNNDATTFFLYKDKLMEYFENNKDCKLVIRPHPLMFSKFLEQGIMSASEINEFKEKIFQTENICLDNEMDYWIEFDKTDILIADFSALIIEFFLTGRPIIYCGAYDGFNRQTKAMLKNFYLADSWEDVELYMNLLKNERDNLYEKRQIVLKEFLGQNKENVGKKIIENLILK